MAFKNLYGGIDFQAGNRAAMAQQQQLQQAIGSAYGAYEKQQNRELKERQMEIKAAEVPKLDVKQLAMEGLQIEAMGGQATPEQLAARQVMGQTQSDRSFMDPNTGFMTTIPSPWRGLSTQGAPVRQTSAVGPSLGITTPIPGQRPPVATPEQFAAARGVPQVTGPLAGTPLGTKLEAQAGIDVQKEELREERARKELNKYGQDQLQAASFAHRMKTSNDIMDELSPKAAEAKTGFVGGIAKVLTALPLGDTGTGLGDALIKIGATEEQQRYLNAAQNWVTANLRKESGAAIGIEEMAKDYAKYFPMPLDKPAVIADKKRLRTAAESGMIGQSAGSYQLQFGKKAQALDKQSKSKYTEGQTATNAQGQTITFTGGTWQ